MEGLEMSQFEEEGSADEDGWTQIKPRMMFDSALAQRVRIRKIIPKSVSFAGVSGAMPTLAWACLEITASGRGKTWQC
jgi:hypothetical protein